MYINLQYNSREGGGGWGLGANFLKNIDGFRQNNSQGFFHKTVQTKPIREMFDIHYLQKPYFGFNEAPQSTTLCWIKFKAKQQQQQQQQQQQHNRIVIQVILVLVSCYNRAHTSKWESVRHFFGTVKIRDNIRTFWSSVECMCDTTICSRMAY